MDKLRVLLLLCLVSWSSQDNSCPDIRALKEELKKAELQEALEEVDCITDELRNYRDPCERKKCMDLDDFEESKESPKEYDYLILGAGRAGCVMANRLTEVPDNKVMVLELGQEATSVSKVPALTAYAKFSKFSRTRCLKPQDDFGLACSHLQVIDGFAFGGSSTMSTNVINNGNPTDFSAPTAGCFDDVLSYFRKSEKANLTGTVESAYHRWDGLLPQTHTHISDIGAAFLKCGMEQGYKEIDTAASFGEGFSKIRSNCEGGKRVNHAEAFLKPIASRKNLATMGGVSVYKILFDKEKRAIGVKYVKDKKIYTMLAKKEIVLAWNAIDAAKLLLISGIGPKEHLEKHRVHVVKNLPVGQHLFHKVAYVGLAFETNSTSTPRYLEDIINRETIKIFLESGEGPLARPNHFEALANFKINSQSTNVQSILWNAFWSTDAGEVMAKTIGLSPRFYKKHFKPLEGKRVFSIYLVLTALSSGRVKLRSHEPFEEPEVCGKFFSNPADRKNVVDAIKFVLNLTKCDCFKKYGVKFYDKPIPGCEAHHKRGGDKYWECAAKHLTVPYNELSGTCKMGLPDDPTAVVDPNGLVIGIKGLRIIGGSIMPNPAFTGAGALATMLAEKSCDHIKKQEGIVVPTFCPIPKPTVGVKAP